MADSCQQLRVDALQASLGVMASHLRDSCHATDDELAYLKDILDSRAQKRNSMGVGRGLYGSPSIVLDGFLYHGDFGHASNVTLLKKLGIHRIVNVCDCPLDKAIRDGFQVLWINLNDEFQTDIKRHFDETNEFLKHCKENNEKVLVHCQMGISRSSAIILAYLMKYHHYSLKQAYEYLVERRRIAAPNLSFFLQLIRYERELRASESIGDGQT